MLDERQRMAREIHDTIAQGLIGIVTQLEAADQARDRPADRDRHLDNAERLARESLTEARRSVEASMPAALEAGTLPDALADVAREWSEINGIPVDGRRSPARSSRSTRRSRWRSCGSPRRRWPTSRATPAPRTRG